MLIVPYVVLQSCNVGQQNASMLMFFFHNIMYMFRTQWLIFRKTVVTNTGRVQCVSTCMVQSGTSVWIL